MELILLIPLCSLFFLGIKYYRLQKRIYETESDEFKGKVISVEKHQKQIPKLIEKHYITEITTPDGKQLKIDTRKKPEPNIDVTILVPKETYPKGKYNFPPIIKGDKKIASDSVLLIIAGIFFIITTLVDILIRVIIL